MTMENLLVIIVTILCLILISYDTIRENFWPLSRPNKCFSCEKQITSISNAHESFPSKCYDCEKQALMGLKETKDSTQPYFTGKTKCFDCDNQANTFSTFNRNSVLNKV